MANPTRKRRLGRGLNSLVGDAMPVEVVTNSTEIQTNTDQTLGSSQETSIVSPNQLALDLISVNEFQPRTAVESADLQELADSIKLHGIMQPLVVRPKAGGQYELVAGERRWRAAKIAGLQEVPVVVRDIDDRTSAEWALVENMQRRDLNTVDRAQGLARLRDEFAMTQTQIAESVGLDRSSVSNLMRILDLEPELLDLVRTERLSMGHARALLSLPAGPSRLRAGEQAAAESWSVRRLETLASSSPQPTTVAVTDHAAATKAAHMRHLESAIAEQLGTRVRVATKAGGKKGSITIEFFDGEHFEGLLSRLGVTVNL